MDMAILGGNTTPSSRETDQNLTYSGLIPSFRLALNPEVNSPLSVAQCLPSHQPGHLECSHTAPCIATPNSALLSSILPTGSPTISILSSSTSNDTNLLISPSPSVPFISEFFRARVPNHRRRQENLVRGTQSWVQAVAQNLPETIIHNTCIAHYVKLREQSKHLILSSGKGRRTAAFKATAKELSLQTDEVRKAFSKGVNYLLLARLGGPGSLLLIRERVRILWEKDLLSDDIPHLLQFRKEHMLSLDVQARQLNDHVIETISRYIAAKDWNGIPLMTCLTEQLAAPVHARERAVEICSEHQKRSASTLLDAQLDRPSKRLAHEPSADLGLIQLLEAANHEECQDTFVNPCPQQVRGPEITAFMTTFNKDGQSNIRMQDLSPWEPDITELMTPFNENGQASIWMQDQISWRDGELDITELMTTFENDQLNSWMQNLVPLPVDEPKTAHVKDFISNGQSRTQMQHLFL